MAFQEGQSQGYGSHWWSTGREDEPSGRGGVLAQHTRLIPHAERMRFSCDHSSMDRLSRK
jgi:hypothetical protein